MYVYVKRAESADNSPRAYALEVQALEAVLGSEHPAVAESLSNLAVVHYQRGEFEQALPVYARYDDVAIVAVVLKDRQDYKQVTKHADCCTTC